MFDVIVSTLALEVKGSTEFGSRISTDKLLTI